MQGNESGWPARIGVIGLGIMGESIARNLAVAGWRVSGFDTDPARCRVAQEHGVEIAASATEVAAAADLVLTSLPSVAALRVTAQAIAAGRRTGAVVAELSTLPLDAKLEAEAALRPAGVILLDCPLSGTGAQAATRDLVVYASGDAAAFERCVKAFGGFSRRSYYLGAFGNGTKMKFVANLLVAIHNVAAAEAIVLGLRAGLDPATLCEVAGAGAGGSRVLELRGPMMVRGVYEPATMKLEIWQKDMQLIGDFAARCGVPTPLFSAAAPLYEAAIAAGRDQQDTAAVCALLQDMVKPRISTL